MLSIRPAKESDVSLLKNLILELADYERERHLVTISFGTGLGRSQSFVR